MVAKLWTEEEIQALPDDGYIHEIVDGELVLSPKNNFDHEHICARLFFALEAFNRQHRLGAVLGSNLGCWMQNRNVRAPDISFITKDRLLNAGFKPRTKLFFPGAPDLTIEVISNSNSRREIDARLKDFFSSGTRIAWLIHPDEQFVEVCHSPVERRMLGTGAELVLPGFRYKLDELFLQDWD